jgi:catechol 2,3-dioxygenase-like lactoylglutathione lyase family enzyme
MLNVLKLGHAEFAVRDLDRMAEFYKNVIGLTETKHLGRPSLDRSPRRRGQDAFVEDCVSDRAC